MHTYNNAERQADQVLVTGTYLIRRGGNYSLEKALVALASWTGGICLTAWWGYNAGAVSDSTATVLLQSVQMMLRTYPHLDSNQGVSAKA